MDINKTRQLLNSLFLLGTLISIIVYFAVENRTYFVYVCGITLFIKVIEFIIRFTNR